MSISSVFTSRAIITRAQKILLLKKNGAWTLPGGKANPLETPEQAALREAWEETGVACEGTGRLLGERLHPVSQKQIIYIHFSQSRGRAYNREPDKHQKVAWAEPDKAMLRLGDTVFPPVRDLLIALKDRTLTP